MSKTKLVRDKIPDLITSEGRTPKTHIAGDDEFKIALKDKLKEECDEYAANNAIEELADILEVVYTLAEIAGTDIASLEKIRKNKTAQKGGFTQKVILEEG